MARIHKEALYKKDLPDPCNHGGVITHLELDILECEVKWPLESITTNKASEGDGIPVDLESVSDPKISCCESAALSTPANLENSAVVTGLEKVSFHSIPFPKKGNPKKCSIYHTVALISHASKVMLKILQARFQQYMNCEPSDVQAGFRKGRRTRDKVVNIHWIIKKARELSTSALLTTPKPLTVWITTNCGKFLKGWEYQTTLPAS